MKSEFVYSLPFKQETLYLAVSDPSEHNGRIEHAIDFLIDFDKEIIAPLGGIVWNVKDNSKTGGSDEKYADWKYQNLITIKHSETEYSQYFHLAHKSALVKIGDKVKKGQTIARGVGMTGCTTTPHVHMLVFRILEDQDNGFESKKIMFDKKVKVFRSTKEIRKEFKKKKYARLKELEGQYPLP